MRKVSSIIIGKSSRLPSVIATFMTSAGGEASAMASTYSSRTVSSTYGLNIARSISSSTVLSYAGKSGKRSKIQAPSSATTPAKPERSMDDVLSNIDTTLTPEQREHVDKLKKLIRGGPNAPRSLYRDVATLDELVGEGNFFPRLADNAESLVDYALSFIPKKDGYRGSRRKKRMASKMEIKLANCKTRKIQSTAANLRKQATRKKDNELAKAYRRRAAEMRQAAAAIPQSQNASA